MICAILGCLAALLCAQPVLGLRCDGRIVELGDRSSQVARICGEPDHIDHRQEERFGEYYYYLRRNSRSKDPGHLPFFKKEIVDIEEWTYNFGPTKFIQYLFFENGRLMRIDQGEKGYYR